MHGLYKGTSATLNFGCCCLVPPASSLKAFIIPDLSKFTRGVFSPKTHLPIKELNSGWVPACSREGKLLQIQGFCIPQAESHIPPVWAPFQGGEEPDIPDEFQRQGKPRASSLGQGP